MSTSTQKDRLYKLLKEYKKRYLRKQYAELDESATRLMVNNLLTDVFGYAELEDIKTEYNIKGVYADYIIQLQRKKYFIIEVKAVQLDLSSNHLRQALGYAANEGIDWILLTNGRQIELYRVIFSKPIDCKKIFSFNLLDDKELKESVEYLIYLTKKAVLHNELNNFWKRFQALDATNLCKQLYSSDVIKYLRKTLKKTTGLIFTDDDILESIHQIIIKAIPSAKPRSPLGGKLKEKSVKKPDNLDISLE